MTDVPGESFKTIPELSPGDRAAALSPEGPKDSGTEEFKLLSANYSRSEVGDLAEQAKRSEHDRTERFKDHFEYIAVASMYVIAFVILIVGSAWFWHLLTPRSWHFLDPEDISKLQNIVTGGVIAGIAANHFKKRLS